ncbi:hypothetical protein TRFO_10233 [Tritrichomonas foetus]|uniref:Transmembrane 9 superfamily member n=1 Tax=Tritrichomonas foetus TaxID=1144522 RepID=A0A1J4JA58_9EUKA|nr:hypothetical protein TRFO_10233 [Tritrichomonas foetus]|eukprot:OHS96048.1 hypothetical protein TRFO_10233 [Tritrichomonas foetus]
MLLFVISFFSIHYENSLFKKGDTVPVQISSLTSEKHLFPMSLNQFCDNFGTNETDFSLGANLIGYETYKKTYDFIFNLKPQNSQNVLICSKNMTAKDINYLFNNQYRFNFRINRFKVKDEDDISGLKIIQNRNYDSSIINNHFSIEIHYKNTNRTSTYKIVKVTGIAESKYKTLFIQKEMNLNKFENQKIDFTFNVKFIEDQLLKDELYSTTFEQNLTFILLLINTFCIIYMVFFFCNFKNNETNLDFEEYEENSWYFVRGDIFRNPRRLPLLCSLSGIGFQLFFVGLFASFSKYPNEASLVNRLIFYLILLSPLSGFISIRMFKIADGTAWRNLISINALLAPIIVLISFILSQSLNFVFQSAKMLTVQNFSIILGCILLHIILSTIGSFFSLKIAVPQLPFKVNLIPKQIVKQPFYLQGIPRYLIVGFYVFLNLYSIFKIVLKMNNNISEIIISKVFGFESLMLMFTSSFNVTLFYMFLSIKKEDYRWWWSAFLGPSFCGVFYILLAVYQYIFYEKGNIASLVIYACQHLMIGGSFSLTAGFCGFFSCFLFLLSYYNICFNSRLK